MQHGTYLIDSCFTFHRKLIDKIKSLKLVDKLHSSSSSASLASKGAVVLVLAESSAVYLISIGFKKLAPTSSAASNGCNLKSFFS